MLKRRAYQQFENPNRVPSEVFRQFLEREFGDERFETVQTF
jgi:hypothetical protein